MYTQAKSIHISINITTLWLWPVRAIPLPWSSCKTSAKQHLGVVVEGKIRTLQKRPFKPVPVRFAQHLQDFRLQILDKFRAHLGLVGPHWVSSRLGRSLHAKTQPMRSWHSWACLVLWMVTMEACPNIPSDRRDISFWHEDASNWWPLGTLTWISFCSAKVEESEEGNCLMPFDAIYIKYAWKARKLRSQHGTTSSKSCEQKSWITGWRCVEPAENTTCMQTQVVAVVGET